MTRTSQTIVAATVLLASLASQAVFAPRAAALDPIQGSITFTGQPATKLQKSPIGSTLSHSFYADGTRYEETYIIRDDRSLELVHRQRMGNR
ncbi:hypothetical protein [Rhizobium sp. SSA_523]|uniref:hypothetical protein n=1 Tax=Rhizobium sp. SSA_523 TaxID=2952477 RepID=UPI0020902D51|nr:hypothetical protein [Rhizobium sp. SSA_523]MCO5733442.1 hypothetical protein [Rhizobium sp. SSA_523]WKC21588.1 hypothetical protein QTJ18_06860 [Rhizobium sp. SSA_523]